MGSFIQIATLQSRTAYSKFNLQLWIKNAHNAPVPLCSSITLTGPTHHTLITTESNKFTLASICLSHHHPALYLRKLQ